MIDTSDKYFLMIEPNIKAKPTDPINDDLTEKVKYIYERTVMPSPGQRYKGTHQAFVTVRYDGEHFVEMGSTDKKGHKITRWVSSDNADHYLPDGTITNSLCVFYVQCFRDQIPKVELDKIEKFYKMCKKSPNKIYQKGWERSVYKPFKIRKYVEPTKAEYAAQREKWQKEWAEKAKKEEAEYQARKKADPRSQFWKDAMERSDIKIKY